MTVTAAPAEFPRELAAESGRRGGKKYRRAIAAAARDSDPETAPADRRRQVTVQFKPVEPSKTAAELEPVFRDLATYRRSVHPPSPQPDGRIDLLLTLPTDSLDWHSRDAWDRTRVALTEWVNARPKFTSTEKLVLTAEELEVDTVADFRALLALVQERSGLTYGQIAAKTSIGRSSVFNLADVRRTGLPTKGDHVQEFLCACGLQLRQVSTVMRSWELLNAQRAKPTGKPASAAPPAATPITQLSPREILQEAVGSRGPDVTDFAVRDIAREFRRLRTLLPILLSIGILLGWRYFNTTTTTSVPGFEDSDGALFGTITQTTVSPWAAWYLLAVTELAFMALLLRWRLRRTAVPRPHAKSKRGKRLNGA